MIIDRIDEEFLLLALHPDGRWADEAGAKVEDGLAGAWLADLLIEGKVKLDGDKIVARRKPEGTGDAVDWALGEINKAKPADVKTWLTRLAKHAEGQMGVVTGRLVGRGYVERRADGKHTRFPLQNPNARNDLNSFLKAVLTGKQPPDEPSLALLTVIEGAGFLGHVFGSHNTKQGHLLLERLLTRDHRFKTLSEAMKTPKFLRVLGF